LSEGIMLLHFDVVGHLLKLFDLIKNK